MQIVLDPQHSLSNVQDVAIVGGDGYIGSALNSYLIKQGYTTVIYDYHTDGIGVQDYEATWASYDALVYLGNIVGAPIDQSIIDNVIAPITVMEEAIEAGIRMIYVSSLDAEFPNSSFHALSKYIAEVQAMRLTSLNGDIRILRIANVYGGRDFLKQDSVIAKFAKQKSKKEHIVVDSNGAQRRDFIHLYDVLDAIHRALATEWESIEEQEMLRKPIDIGTGKSTPIINLARMFNHDHTFDENAKIPIVSKIADPSKADELFDFKATRKLSDYMKGI